MPIAVAPGRIIPYLNGKARLGFREPKPEHLRSVAAPTLLAGRRAGGATMAIPVTTHKSFAEIAEDTAKLIHGDLWPAYSNDFGAALLADFWLDRHTDRDGVSQVMLKLNRGDRELEPADRRLVFRMVGTVARPTVVRDTREGTDPSWSLLAKCKLRDWDTQAWQYLLDALYLPNAVAAEWMKHCDPAQYKTGLPGRPTIRHFIITEFERRKEAGELCSSLGKEAEYLHNWAALEHPNAPRATTGTIENQIRAPYRKHELERGKVSTK